VTVFLRILEDSVDEKPEALLRAVAVLHNLNRQNGAFHRVVFEHEPATFASIPGSPFAYWVSKAARETFQRLPAFESENRTVKQGLATADDFRFVRAWWEIPPERMGERWFGFAKGGAFSPFYADVLLVLEWRSAGGILKAKVIAEHGNVGKRIYNGVFRESCG
jgi:hypothetical protein